MSAVPQPDPPRRRFGRRAADRWAAAADLASLEAELVLLREENARLKLAGHRERPDLAGLLGQARAIGEPASDDDSATDETTQMLVEALVIRESLMEICRALERSMVTYQAKLNALLDATVQRHRAPSEEEVPHRNGNGPELA
jgi:hypothetical protein